MRILLSLASILLLAGCTDADWSHVMPNSGGGSALSYPENAAAANYAAYVIGRSATPEQKCARVAQERSGDAAEQGFDAGVQQHVHDQTFTDCMTWQARENK